VLPALMFLGFAMVCVGLSFSILGVETHGVPMTLEEEEDAEADGEVAERPAIAG